MEDNYLAEASRELDLDFPTPDVGVPERSERTPPWKMINDGAITFCTLVCAATAFATLKASSVITIGVNVMLAFIFLGGFFIADDRPIRSRIFLWGLVLYASWAVFFGFRPKEPAPAPTPVVQVDPNQVPVTRSSGWGEFTNGYYVTTKHSCHHIYMDSLELHGWCYGGTALGRRDQQIAHMVCKDYNGTGSNVVYEVQEFPQHYMLTSISGEDTKTKVFKEETTCFLAANNAKKP